MKFSKLIVTGVIILNILFATVVLYDHYKTGSEPSTLIGAWFGFTTIELWSLASIKKTQVKNNRGPKQEEWRPESEHNNTEFIDR